VAVLDLADFPRRAISKAKGLFLGHACRIARWEQNRNIAN
jgi:hypothetical protein